MHDQRIIKTINKASAKIDEEFNRLYQKSSINLSPCLAISSVRGLTVLMRGVANPPAVIAEGEELLGLLYISGSAHIRIAPGFYSAVISPKRLIGELRDEDGETMAIGDLQISPVTSQAPIIVEFYGKCSVEIGSSFSKPLYLHVCCDSTTDTTAPFGVSSSNCLTIDLTKIPPIF